MFGFYQQQKKIFKKESFFFHQDCNYRYFDLTSDGMYNSEVLPYIFAANTLFFRYIYSIILVTYCYADDMLHMSQIMPF